MNKGDWKRKKPSGVKESVKIKEIILEGGTNYLMTEEMYTRGDWLVHAHYGVGQVKRKEKKNLEGVKKVFLRVKTLNAEYWLPVKNTEVSHIRPLASEYQIKKAISLIRKPPSALPKNFKDRRKDILEILKGVSLYSRAKMIRDLHSIEISSKTNYSDKVSLQKMKQQLLNEWSVILDEDIEILEEKLKSALRISMDKKEVGNMENGGENQNGQGGSS